MSAVGVGYFVREKVLRWAGVVASGTPVGTFILRSGWSLRRGSVEPQVRWAPGVGGGGPHVPPEPQVVDPPTAIYTDFESVLWIFARW